MRVELALSLAGHDKGHYYVVVGEVVIKRAIKLYKKHVEK